MFVCVECKNEMCCDKNAVGADFGNGHVYPSDRFKCLSCGKMILSTNRAPIFDSEHKTQDEYFDMADKEKQSAIDAGILPPTTLGFRL